MKVFTGLAVLLVLVAASLGAHHQSRTDPPECPEAIPGVVLNATFYPNEDDCSKYWQCDQGNLYNGSCADGLVWNPNVDSCDWPYNYDCPYDKIASNLQPYQDIVCPQPSPGEQMNVTFYPNEEDCSKYWLCTNGELFNATCTGDLIWNPTIDTCDWPYNYDCPYDKMVSNLIAKQDIDCPQPSPGEQMNVTFYPNEEDCSKYWLCTNGELFNASCPDDLIWNPTVNTCDWPYNYDCPYDMKKPISILEFVCPPTNPRTVGIVTYYPNGKDIQKYWECLDGEVTERDCGSGMVWDRSLKKCAIQFS